MGSINQRKFNRKRCMVQVEGEESGVFGDLCALDISRGGMGFISHKAIPLHKKIPVEVEAGIGHEPIVMLGEVKWVRPLKQQGQYRIGMKFVKVLSSGSRSRLTCYFGE